MNKKNKQKLQSLLKHLHKAEQKITDGQSEKEAIISQLLALKQQTDESSLLDWATQNSQIEPSNTEEKQQSKPLVTAEKSPVESLTCSACNHTISENVQKFSVEKYSKQLCVTCQKQA